MIGASLNQYQITAKIGQGGMGEVFRARDTRLNREVAIKMLPKDFAGDPDRLRRFEPESKTLAALNHPNVLMVFDAGVHEGGSGARWRYVSMSNQKRDFVELPQLLQSLKKLFDLPDSISPGYPSFPSFYAGGPEGDRFLMLQRSRDGPASPHADKANAVAIENWVEESRERK